MKSRVRRIANFVAFNLLFFALYLNFIHKDNASTIEQLPQPTTVGFTSKNLTEKKSQRPEEKSTVDAQESLAQLNALSSN